MIGRALLAFALLPGVVAVVVPLLLSWPALREGPFNWIALTLLVPGTGLLVWCVRDFYVRGKGTLAPWAPPRHLVDTGPYRVSRNPMYVAVSLILIGWAIGFASRALFLYALVVMVAFHLRVVVNEEPWLARTHRELWTRYASRVPRWLFRSRRAVAYAWLAVAVLLPIAGLIYEAYADGMAGLEYTAPGRMVDIGGRRLHLLCIGTGAPTVVFEAASFQTALSSSRARERIAARTTVCSYDRSGMGFSDPAPADVSSGDLARDLAVLQDRARLPWPFVIVASSIGGLTAEMFARQFPERVAGLVFLDASNSTTLNERRQWSPWVKPVACVSSALSRFGLIRLLDPFAFGEATEDARRAAALTYNSRPWGQICAMARALPRSIEEFAAAPPLRGDLPLRVLSAASAEEILPPAILRFVDTDNLRALARDSHQRFAKQSSRGTWAEVPDSTHLIAGSQPDAVAEIVFELLQEIR
jgi:protein-S-isoprenylcysteine O-methyltransferase Ste14/pimeloyl-ACP methyl ester carboxylesterase